jgi:hypothetical protein
MFGGFVIMESIDAEIVKMFVQGNCPHQLLDRAYALRNQSIEKAMDPSVASSHASTFEVPDIIISKYGKNKLAKEIEGKRVIELGPAHNPRAKLLLDLGAKEYVGVELFNSFMASCFTQNYNRAKIVQKDALSYLINQEEGSAVVVSFGFLCDALHIYNPHYIPFITKEIQRITPKDGVSVHSGSCDFANSFNAAGFSSKEVLKVKNDKKENYLFLGVFKK